LVVLSEEFSVKSSKVNGGLASTFVLIHGFSFFVPTQSPTLISLQRLFRFLPSKVGDNDPGNILQKLTSAAHILSDNVLRPDEA
jgi:hypothetical protein